MNRRRLTLLALIVAALACNAPSFSTNQPPPPTQGPTPPLQPPTDVPTRAPPTATLTLTLPPPTPNATAEPVASFRVIILVDTSSEPVERSEAELALQEASEILYMHTGFIFELMEFVEMAPLPGVERHELPGRWIEAHLDDLPDGIIFYTFGTDNSTTGYGGYSSMASVPDPTYRNPFRNVRGIDNQIYVANLHWSHRYAQCGYGDSTLAEPVSDVAINGECRNQPGTACVDQYGYSMCSTALDDLYASTPTYFKAAVIVHEFLHPFGMHGAGDHYGTETCKESMGWDASWRFDFTESQRYVVMCPYTFDNFAAGYQP